MKKFFLIFCTVILSASSVLANFEDYYQFESNLDVKFIKNTSIKNKEYKKIEKNEKYMKQGKYSKADNFYPDFIPNLSRFINIYTDRKNYQKALYYAEKLVELDTSNLFPKSAKDYRLGVLYSLNGDYLQSNKYLYPYVNTNSWARFQMAQNYYYMQDMKTAESYAIKVLPSEGAYFGAQELLYNIYNVTKNPQKAYTVAKNLIKLDVGNPENYMRVANSTTNNAEKLTYYTRAKQLYLAQNLLNMNSYVNSLIAPIEQKKIDEAYKKITVYCKKPDWFKIKSRNENLLKDDNSYWNNRQDEFFEAANECLSRYSGNNLAACFKDLNDTQERLDSALVAEAARREEVEQRNAQIQQLVRQNMLLEEQNMIQRTRYYNNYYYPRYYYRNPYWW